MFARRRQTDANGVSPPSSPEMGSPRYDAANSLLVLRRRTDACLDSMQHTDTAHSPGNVSPVEDDGAGRQSPGGYPPNLLDNRAPGAHRSAIPTMRRERFRKQAQLPTSDKHISTQARQTPPPPLHQRPVHPGSAAASPRGSPSPSNAGGQLRSDSRTGYGNPEEPWATSPRGFGYGNAATVTSNPPAPPAKSQGRSSPAGNNGKASLGQRVRQQLGGKIGGTGTGAAKAQPLHTRPAWNGASGRTVVPPPIHDDPTAAPLPARPLESPKVFHPVSPQQQQAKQPTSYFSPMAPGPAGPSLTGASPTTWSPAAVARVNYEPSIKSIKRKPAPAPQIPLDARLIPSQSRFSLSTADTSRPGTTSSGSASISSDREDGGQSAAAAAATAAAAASSENREAVKMTTPRSAAIVAEEARSSPSGKHARAGSVASLSKALPLAPPEVMASGTTDRVAVLNAKLEALAHRRNNVSRSIKQMTELMPADRLLESSEVLRKRGEEKAKVERLREELADIQQEEYTLGLKLHRAYKRQDREDDFETGRLWVRRMTSS